MLVTGRLCLYNCIYNCGIYCLFIRRNQLDIFKMLVFLILISPITRGKRPNIVSNSDRKYKYSMCTLFKKHITTLSQDYTIELFESRHLGHSRTGTCVNNNIIHSMAQSHLVFMKIMQWGCYGKSETHLQVIQTGQQISNQLIYLQYTVG